MARKKGKPRTMKIGRNAEIGRFIPITVARKRKKTAIVEIIKR